MHSIISAIISIITFIGLHCIAIPNEDESYNYIAAFNERAEKPVHFIICDHDKQEFYACLLILSHEGFPSVKRHDDSIFSYLATKPGTVIWTKSKGKVKETIVE